MSYIFPLEKSNVPNKNAGLAELRAFLVHPEDGVFLDELVKYEVPASYEVKRFDDGSAFVCIKIELDGQIGDLSFTKLPLRIAAILTKGMDSEWTSRDRFRQDPVDLVKQALASDDVFVIYGNMGLPKLFSDLVGGILGLDVAKLPDIPLDEYKNQLLLRLGSEDALSSKFDSAYELFNQSPQTRASALKILGEIYDEKSILELRKIMDLLRQGDGGFDHRQQKIIRHIYSLPHNLVKYEDNGKAVLADTIERLREVASSQEEGHLLDRLQKLSGDEILDDAWFDELADIRKQLMLIYLAPPNPFISGELRSQIMDVLSMHSRSDAAVCGSTRNKSIFTQYIEDITSEMLSRYRNQFNGTVPFVCCGVCVIDMDACTNKLAIGEALCNSEKIILLGSQMTGVYRRFLLGANARSAVDGKPRIGYSGITSSNVRRMWYYPETLDVTDFVRQNAEKMLSFGILASNPRPDLAKKLESSDIGSIICKIGSLHDLYYDVFDMLIWFVESTDGDHMLSSAYARVSDTLVFVGDPDGLPVDSLLLQIYNALAGEDIYGK